MLWSYLSNHTDLGRCVKTGMVSAARYARNWRLRKLNWPKFKIIYDAR